MIFQEKRKQEVQRDRLVHIHMYLFNHKMYRLVEFELNESL